MHFLHSPTKEFTNTNHRIKQTVGDITDRITEIEKTTSSITNYN